MPKLTKVENDTRKTLKALAREEGFTVQYFPELGVTIIHRDEGNTVQVTWSIAAEADRAKRKHGEYAALNRWMNQGTFPVPSKFFNVEFLATDLSFGMRDEKGNR